MKTVAELNAEIDSYNGAIETYLRVQPDRGIQMMKDMDNKFPEMQFLRSNPDVAEMARYKRDVWEKKMAASRRMAVATYKFAEYVKEKYPEAGAWPKDKRETLFKDFALNLPQKEIDSFDYSLLKKPEGPLDFFRAFANVVKYWILWVPRNGPESPPPPDFWF
uniref:Uncharacterized protein n=1 Tax=Chromera velia CCMP2878 TaxID=1169474 RepID=A0A0G4HNH7_9ALVE|eukprot:Cvel_7603.t1-p1 / transcript=Cvel_7603.t1 / gene=Cvel_7603 / organism=Chromera_velia_CCMP2878 / gene_product=hypothetical protein / transcript_product=hypothetical protein / location=Cvel_scaffold401:2273-2758(+) / protein_length=162 / sequence_SO=supercontig / SO=protein_coding / is_pseudo=false